MQRTVTRIVFYSLLTLLLVFVLFPLFWMIIQSLKRPIEMRAIPPIWVFTPSFAGYRHTLGQGFMRYFFNSTFIGGASLFLSMFFGLMFAYSIARFRQAKLGMLVLVSRMIPAMVIALPLFLLFRELGLIDTYTGIVATHITRILPLTTWIMVGFFEDLPIELEESAYIDGCSRFWTFLKISVPLVQPGIMAASILGIVQSWNNFVFVLILGGRRTMTLPLAAYRHVGFETVDWQGLYSSATLIILPLVIATIVLQRYLVSGLTVGAVK